MSRELLVGLALHAYPSDVRAALGAEMASTALDAGAGHARSPGSSVPAWACAPTSGRDNWSPMASVSPRCG